MTPDDAPHGTAETLQLFLGAAKGGSEELFLIERPTADGLTRVRHWSGGDWSALPTSRDRDAGELLTELERAVRAGRSLNVEMPIVRRWLRAEPEPRAR